MLFMKDDRITLDLGQYLKNYLLSLHYNDITIFAFKYKNQCVMNRAVMTKRFACCSYKPCPFLPHARALHI